MDKKSNLEKNTFKIYSYDILLAFLSILGVVNIVLLGLKSFGPGYSLTVGVSLTLIAYYLLKRFTTVTIVFKDSRTNILFVILILLSLILRLPPNLYIIGGQDQGTYVNMAQQYSISHALYAKDSYREPLTNDQKELYDRDGNYIMPSFEKWNRLGSEYTMRFYPAYPSLLSTISFFSGADHMVYLLTLFSLIVLVNLYLITYYLTGSKDVSLVVLLLFTLNPVHVFFSKFPVGEMAALAFSTSGFYFLLRYLKSENRSNNKIMFLIFSLMAFLVLSLTRATFFSYIPIMFLLVLASKKPDMERWFLSLYLLFAVVVLHLSYIYYKLFLYPLYEGIYPKTVGFILDKYFPINISDNYKIAVIYALTLVFLYLINIKDIPKLLKKYLPVIYTIIIFVLVYKIALLTQKDLNIILLNTKKLYVRWNILYRGLDAIKHIPLFSISNYMSIFGFAVFLFVTVRNIFEKQINKYHFLTIAGLYFTFIYLYKTGLMRYDYYNSRYFLTEVIPALLLTTGIFLGEYYEKGGLRKIISTILIVLISLYFSLFSFFQLGKYEGNGNYFFKKVSEDVSTEDLIVFINKNIYDSKYGWNFNSYVAGPLKYYYNLNVLVLRNSDEVLLETAQSIINKHQNVFYISNIPIDDNKSFINQEKITLKYNHFNNSPGCNYHNYEFLRIDNIKEIPLPDSLKCKLLPNAYYERSRDFYFGEIVLDN